MRRPFTWHKTTACLGKDLGEMGGKMPEEHQMGKNNARRRQVDYLCHLRLFQNSTKLFLYSILYYLPQLGMKKTNLNTSDMHPFIHPLSALGIDPVVGIAVSELGNNLKVNR